MADDDSQARALITTLCGWHVTPQQTETLTVDTLGDRVVFLPTKYLVDVTEVKVDGEVVDQRDYTFSQDGILRLTRRVPLGFQTVQATVLHGYESAPEVEALIEKITSRATKPSEAYTVGGISVGSPGSLMPQSTEWRIIDQHKLGPMP